MKKFDRFFDIFEKAASLVSADRLFIGNLALLEDRGRLSFIEDASTAGARRFLIWFRWVFLAMSIGFSVFVHQTFVAGGHGVAVVIYWSFIVFALALGLAGVFIIVPTFCRLFSRIQSLGDGNNSRLPSFDLINRTVNPPDSKSSYPFDRIVGLKSAQAVDGWNKLVLLTGDNQVVFLVNYPVSKTKSISKMLDRISELTSIKILE